jgi:hypothetical protein
MTDKFELTQEHLLLCARAYVYWEDDEFGAPAIDCKRPYGNSGVLADIAEILGEEANHCPHCHENLDDSDEDRHRKLHREMEIVLQILLDMAGDRIVDTGTYVRSKQSRHWRKSDDDKYGEKECTE